MGMEADSSRVAALRSLAASAGVEPADGDLVAVLGFLDRILPQLGRLDDGLPAEEGLELSPDAGASTQSRRHAPGDDAGASTQNRGQSLQSAQGQSPQA